MLDIQTQDSERTYLPNDYLTVKNCLITKEGVYRYKGSEIKDYIGLGLNANEIYFVYRPRKEIQEGKHTFNNNPLIDKHIAFSTDSMPKDNIIGSISDANMQNNELIATVNFWDKNAVDELHSGKKGLSPGYNADYVLDSGVFAGIPYTLKQTNLVANHVAHVENPRTPEAQVQDCADNINKPKELNKMTKKHPTKVYDKDHEEDNNTEDSEQMEEGHIGDKIMDILQGTHSMEHKHKALMSLHKSAHDNMKEEVEEEEGIDKSAMDEEKKEDKEMNVKDGVKYAGKGKNKGAYKYTKDSKHHKEKTMDSDSLTIDEIKKIVMQEHQELETAKSFAIELLGGINQTFDSADEIYSNILTKRGYNVKDYDLNSKKQMAKIISDLSKNTNNNVNMTMDSMFNQDSNMQQLVDDRIARMFEGV